MRRLICALTLLLALAPATAAERVVVLTPDVADIVVAIGAARDVVGRDRSATQPALQAAQEIGFFRNLNAETIARLKPTLVLGSATAHPASIWRQLDGLQIRTAEVSSREDGRDFATGIRRIGQLLGRVDQADRLARDWQAGMREHPATGIRYAISYDGRLVAGRHTAADALIRAAGGINVAAGLSGIKALSRDAWQTLKPDVIILCTHTAAVHGGADAFRQRGRVHLLPASDAMMISIRSPDVVQRLRRL
ncbi:MAG: heme/hemin ABC transporter substrate-binding protein [Microvirgula sp.]